MKLWQGLRKYKKALILAALILLCGLPLLVNILFRTQAPLDILIASWTAGDALAYVGAILTFAGSGLLSIIALIQNEKLSKANDKAQERLEQLNRDSYKQSIISSIVETESRYIEKLDQALSEFGVATSSITISKVVLSSGFHAPELAEIANNISVTFNRVNYLLQAAYQIQIVDIEPFQSLCLNLHTLALDTLTDMIENQQVDGEKLDQLKDLNGQFMIKSTCMLQTRYRMLQMILYEKISLEKIRLIYRAPEDLSKDKTKTECG